MTEVELDVICRVVSASEFWRGVAWGIGGFAAFEVVWTLVRRWREYMAP